MRGEESQNIVWLDLQKVKLLGYEDGHSDKVLDSLVRGIENGNSFPPVPVFKLDEKTYALHSGKKVSLKYSGRVFNHVDGGHHRSLAHFIAQANLKCEIIDEIPDMIGLIPIDKMTIVDDAGEYQKRKAAFPEYY
ncbi:hypothetical protein COU57_06825 [Candidatus Pacearchaeota archaeon CG10_big_fil_rev_8_21_14_0_10_32_14]|nr:MAG: hypothetical protein COU57_06825 [Candidatus Pacearchaeota archaeon CG10_big_fil_rev_8_21_14_0_10_32_14]